MKTDSLGKAGAVDWAAVLARWLLGALFIYMGMNKAMHPVEFLKLVRQYEMVTSPLMLNSIAAALPWFEVYCGLLLLAGVAVRGAALMLLVLLVSFSLVVLRRALVISATQGFPLCAVKFDCGCGTGEVVICHKLLENIALIVLSAWLTVWPRGWLCWRFCATKQVVADTTPAEFHPPPSTSDRPTDDQAKPA